MKQIQIVLIIFLIYFSSLAFSTKITSQTSIPRYLKMRLGPEGLKMGKVGQFCAGALAAYTNTFEKNIIKYLPIKMRRDSPAMQSKIYHALDEIRRGATHIERAMMFPGGEYRKY